MGKTTKILSFLIALIMVLALVPFNAIVYAVDVETGDEAQTQAPSVKKPVKQEVEPVENADLEIGTADELKAFAAAVNAGNSFEGKVVVLTADIDLEYTAVVIGTKTNSFKGTFDGQNYTVSNLTIYEDGSESDYFADSDDCLGLFGVINTPAVVKNVTVDNPYIVGNAYVAGIVGMAYTGAIYNCHVTGEIDIEGYYMVGGITGHGYAKIENCSVIGDYDWDYNYIGATYKEANFEGDNVGGIVGHKAENTTIKGCTVANVTVEGTRKVGGIVGTTFQNNTITDCKVSNVTVGTNATVEYANANLSSMGLGGIIGITADTFTGGTVSNCSVNGLSFTNANNVPVSQGAITGGHRQTSGQLPVAPEGTTFSGNEAANVEGTVNSFGYTVVALPNAQVTVPDRVVIHDYKKYNGSSIVEATGAPIDPQVLLNFKALDSAEEAANGAYGEHYTDFFITLSGLESSNTDGCYLVGNYGTWGWVAIPLAGMNLIDGVYPVMSSILPLTYEDICRDVKDFTCGIYFTPEFLNANPDFEITLDLGLCENLDDAKNGTLANIEMVTDEKEFSYTAEVIAEATRSTELPNAEVNDITGETVDITDYQIYDGSLKDGTAVLNPQIVLEFIAKEENVAGSYYADFTTDFFITLKGIVNPDTTGCYLIGNYGEFGWIAVPLDGMELKDDTYSVITSVGFDFTYENICTVVKDFKCGIYFTPEFLNANPNFEITLDLGLCKDKETAQAADLNNVTLVTTKDQFSYTVEEIKTNRENNSAVAEVNGVKYESVQAAINAAQAGDVITIIADVENEAVTVDKNVTITGAVTLTNVSFNAAGADELTISGLTFTGNSWINSGTAEKLVVSGVTANVTPSNTAYTNSRSAFISLGRNEGQMLDLTIKNCSIVSAGGSNPVLGWACITKANLTGNTFGSASAYQNNSDSVKFMAIGEGAVIEVVNNTVYSNYNGIVFGQNTTRENSYTAIIEGNTFVGSADHIWVEVSDSNTCNGAFNVKGDNTINGNAIKASDIKLHPNVNNFTAYAGVDVVLDENGKIIGGTFVILNEECVADGYAANKNADGTFGIEEKKTYVAMIGENGYETLEAAIAAAKNGDEVVILVAGTYTVPSGKDITITGAVDSVVFDNIKKHAMGGASVTFNNVTFNYSMTEGHNGLQHSGDLVYNKCTFNGQVFLYGTSETFNKCTFNQTDVNNYNVWTYAADDVKFNGCKFYSAGRSLLIYSEGADLYANVVITDCDFISSNAVDGKAAIEMDSSLSAGIKVTIDAATTATGFGNGNVSGNSLWNNKKGNETAANNDITVVVNGVTVLAPVTYVAQIGDKKYTSLQDAINAAQNGETVVLLENINGAITIPEGKNVTLDLNGCDIVGTTNAITNNGTLTINDTVGTGNVYTTDVSAQGRATIVNNGIITINGGWYGDANNDTTDRNPINRGNAIKNFGVAVINGGYFTNVSNQYIGSDAYAYAINTMSSGTTTINNATVYGDINGLIFSDGKTVVNDGSFTLGRPGEENNLWYLAYGDVEINGGTWTRAYKVPSWNTGDPKFEGAVKVSGGTFNVSIPEKNCAEGYIPCDNGDGTYGVVEAPKYNITIAGKTLSLDAAIQVNLYFAKASFAGADEIYAVVQVGTKEAYVIKYGEDGWAVGQDGYAYDALNIKGIAAKEMGDVIRVQFYVGNPDDEVADVKASNEITYSVKEYAYTVIGRDNQPLEAKQSMYALLKYGAAAQKYFKYNTENIVDADLTEAMDQAYATSDVAVTKTQVFIKGQEYRLGNTMSLDDSPVLNYYFNTFHKDEYREKIYATATYIGWDNQEHVITIKADEIVYDTVKGQTLVAIKGLSGADVSSDITLRVFAENGETLFESVYSIEAYLKAAMGAYVSDVYLYQALANYGATASAYLKKINDIK